MNESLILIVDDDKVNRQLMKGVLRKENFRFIEAGNGAEAIDLATENSPDVILMDAVMPVMNGYDAAKSIRNNEITRRIPIVMITALSDKQDKIKAIEAGVDDFISKPIDALELVTRCRSLVNASSLNKQYILATKNPETGCLNRTALLRDLHNKKCPLVLFLEIANFEDIYDLYTMDIARGVEKIFIDQLKVKLASIDIDEHSVYHIYDGQYAILIDIENSDFQLVVIRELCQKISKAVRRTLLRIEEDDFEASVVLGYACSESGAYENATLALRYAKKMNHDIVFADDILSEVHESVSNNMIWVKMVREALDNDRIEPYFQGIYDNKSGMITKYESLARLIGEDGKVYSPYFFMEVAKRSKYYSVITKRMLDKSFEYFKDRTQSVSINLSIQDIMSKRMSSYIISKLEEYSFMAGRISFELLEDENTFSFEEVLNFTAAVKSMGAKISIDDFGSGYSNFQRLLEINPDVLKLDGSLIKDIDKSLDRRNIVETIVEFARRSNIKTVAEFVEDENIQRVVSELGIDMSQGYYFSKPSPIKEI